MTETPQQPRFWQKAWIAFRFIVFGVFGFIIMLWGSLYFVLGSVSSHDRIISPLVCLPLAIGGAAMTLFGVGEWGRWAYLFVFASFPASFLLLSFLRPLFDSSGTVAVILMFACAFVTSRIVRRYYRRRDELKSLEDPSDAG